jgi:hypothetical protein
MTSTTTFLQKNGMIRTFVAAAVVAASLFTMPVVASADSESFADGTTTTGAMDIHRVRVRNETRLTIRVMVDDLQRRHGRGASAWIDTDAQRRGPEFFIGSGLYESDWQIFLARDWRIVGEGPLPCRIDQELRYDRDAIIWATGRGCLGRYSDVRVSAETHLDDTTDFSPDRHRFHPWVERY